MHRANLKHSVSVKYCGKASLVCRRFGISVDNAASVDRYPRTKRVRRVDWRSAIFDVGKIALGISMAAIDLYHALFYALFLAVNSSRY